MSEYDTVKGRALNPVVLSSFYLYFMKKMVFVDIDASDKSLQDFGLWG